MKTHRCAAPGCNLQVPMHMMMCSPHWNTLPPDLRNRIWDAYKAKEQNKPGAEDELMRQARAAIQFLRETKS